MAEQTEAKLYMYDRPSMRNKRFTDDVIGHVVWQLYWILPQTYKKIFFSRTAGQFEGKLHTNVPQALGVQVC